MTAHLSGAALVAALCLAVVGIPAAFVSLPAGVAFIATALLLCVAGVMAE